MRCPRCGRIIKGRHSCFRKDAEKDIKPVKWRPAIRK